MAYNSIEALVNRDEKGVLVFEKPWEYSFEKEWEINGYNEKGVFERYFIYKSIGKLIEDHPDKYMWSKFSTYNNAEKKKKIEEAFKYALKITVDKYPNSYPDRVVFSKRSFDIYGDIADCDSSGGDCKLANDLYEKLWGRKEGACVGNSFLELNNTFGKTKFGGDTMNSAQTAMDKLLEAVAHPNSEYFKHKHGVYSANFYIQLYAKYQNFFVKDLEKVNGLKSFLESYHTLGNFVLVPKGFNRWRGSKSDIKDYWDLSLNYLKKNGYGDFDSDSKCFSQYINYFFLWDYVKSVNNSGYEINPIGMKALTDERNISDFFKTATALIKRRGIFMTAMLKLATKKRDKYEDLQKDVFSTENCYSGFDEVIDKIMSKKYGLSDDDDLKELFAKLKEVKWPTQ